VIKLLVATHNRGKIREYRALLADLPIEVTWLDVEGITDEVDETGSTFAENAALKATAYAARVPGAWVWADDSGLEVDALGGRPGVHSARYGEAGLSDEGRYRRLLEELRPFPPERWTARFHCVVALAEPGGRMRTVDGVLEGRITDRPRGEHGFGYDPVFFLPDRNETLAEVPPEIKNTISHRAVAARKARDLLAQLAGQV
jgi:XTP/dITP diphosphohydrolase